MNLLICKSSLLCVTPFSKDMKVQSCLSASKLLYSIVLFWMLESQTLLLLMPEHLNVSSTPFLTISPQFTPLQKAPRPDFDASVCITKFGSFCLSDLALFNLKFSTHQRSFCFGRLFNTISALERGLENWAPLS